MKHSYKFSYGRKLNYLIYGFILFVKNMAMMLLYCAVIFYLCGIATYYSGNNQELTKLISAVYVISIVNICVLFLLTIFLPKRVIIKQNVIRIKRYTLNLFYLTRGFNDRIVIKDIVECKKYCCEKSFLNLSGPYAVYPLCWEDLVEITTDKRKYLIPVKNAEEFVDEVNKRVKTLNNKNM